MRLLFNLKITNYKHIWFTYFLLKSTEKFIFENGFNENDFELVCLPSIYLLSILGIEDSSYLGVNNFFYVKFILLNEDFVLFIAGSGD